MLAGVFLLFRFVSIAREGFIQIRRIWKRRTIDVGNHASSNGLYYTYTDALTIIQHFILFSVSSFNFSSLLTDRFVPSTSLV